MLKRFAQRIGRELYRTLGLKWEQGLQECQNAVYMGAPGTPGVPGVVSQAQLGREGAAPDYDRQLAEAAERAEAAQKETARQPQNGQEMEQ